MALLTQRRVRVNTASELQEPGSQTFPDHKAHKRITATTQLEGKLWSSALWGPLRRAEGLVGGRHCQGRASSVGWRIPAACEIPTRAEQFLNGERPGKRQGRPFLSFFLPLEGTHSSQPSNPCCLLNALSMVHQTQLGGRGTRQVPGPMGGGAQTSQAPSRALHEL